VADGWCWFVLREKYCWLVADKPSEQGEHLLLTTPHLFSKKTPLLPSFYLITHLSMLMDIYTNIPPSSA
jgi:hypothetical protein